MTEKDSDDSDGPIIDDNVIRIQLRKPCQRKWELRTRNMSPGIRFPTIQLFDCEGNLLVETNDENVSIKSCDYNEHGLKTSQSLRERDIKHYIDKKSLRKHNTINGDKIYTRVYKKPLITNNNVEKTNTSYVIKDSDSVVNIPNKLTLNNFSNLQANSLDTTPFQSDGLSEISSYKSSDNDDIIKQTCNKEVPIIVKTPVENSPDSDQTSSSESLSEFDQSTSAVGDKEKEVDLGLHKSKSFNDNELRGSTKGFTSDTLPRSKSGVCVYNPPHNKVPFLNTYLKSLPMRASSNPDWFALHQRRKIENPQNQTIKRQASPKNSPEKMWRLCKRGDNTSENEFINIPTDVAADCEMKKRLKMYRRGLSEIETRRRLSGFTKRRHSVCDVTPVFQNQTSSSESVDEADLVLNRLKRRILKNRIREKRRSIGAKYQFRSDAEPVWKLQDPGFDQGYGSERSPEDDYVAPIMPPVSLEQYEAELRTVYPFINDENTFTVVVEKDGRGLGMSVCGGGGLVRIRRLYPPQPAWRTGRLAPRDLLLSANGVPLAGLSTYEALEVLRTASARVELRVCRPPPDALESVTPPDPPTPPVRTPHPPHLPPLDPLNCHPMHARLSQTTSSATTSSSEGRGRREHSPEADRRDLHLPDLDQALPVYDIQYGDDGSVEFDIIMTKVNGSLGFTLRKEDHSALGHYVRALVREPALSDGRIQPGDRIVAVNDTPMSNMSHAEAVAFLRACGSEVRLRLYRDHAATPLSPMSPKEEPTDSDVPMNRPKPPLRPEAVSMLCDLAARRLTPDTADGSRSPCLSPRKFRKLTKENNHYEQPSDVPSTNITVESHSSDRSEGTQDTRRPLRVHSVAHASSTAPTCRKQKLSLTVPPHGYELNNLDNDTLDAPNVYQEDMIRQRYTEPAFPVESDEPVSMPAELSSDEARFKHANPAYQSAVLHSSSNSDGTSDGHGHKDDKRLKKWKGVALSPDNERKIKIEAPTPPPPKEIETVQKENVKPDPPKDDTSNEPTIVTVELNRGWNSRLGFSVQSHPDSGQSYISAVYNDSVAARDGRLRRGDVILQVNDENVTSMKTPEVIDLLRILRGSICITVLRPPNSQ